VSFAKLMSALDYPMCVVTTAVDGERAGCLVGFGTQTSIHPPRFLTCISVKNHTYAVAQRASALAVHFLSDEPRERELAGLFGGETGDDTDKFERARWHDGPGGVPFLDDIPNRFAGRILDRFELGDHVGFLLAPIETDTASGFDELGFQETKGIEPGHPP
jgi:flavin reductase (DIM6/NTAB) family NADH-FMN oxidoreductase RutF